MDIVCLDMEGTLTPEIWEQVSIDSGVHEFNKTTRDIPSYTELMDYRIEIMKQHDLKSAADKVERFRRQLKIYQLNRFDIKLKYQTMS